jgi:hypothetical protein
LALLVCLFLGGLIYLELEAADQAGESVVTMTAATPLERAALPAQVAYDAPDFAEFAEAMERPLFAPSRRPPSEIVPVTVEAAPQQQAFGFELVGVLISPDERLALIRQDGLTDLHRVGLGRSLNGWQIEQIEPDHVVFRAGETVRQVNLRDDRPPVQETPRERRRRERQEQREQRNQEVDDAPRDPSEPARADGERLGRAEIDRRIMRTSEDSR